MIAHELLSRQKQEPFTPFKIHMSDGRDVEIEHPEQMLVYRNSVVVARRENGDLPERGEKFSVLHITSLEGVETH
jgi:hypothetical protein